MVVPDKMRVAPERTASRAARNSGSARSVGGFSSQTIVNCRLAEGATEDAGAPAALPGLAPPSLAGGALVAAAPAGASETDAPTLAAGRRLRGWAVRLVGRSAGRVSRPV